MADEQSTAKAYNPPGALAPDSIGAERNEDQNVAVANKTNAAANEENSNSTKRPRWKLVKQFWEFSKKPESTNVAMAVATIVIAVATVFTWSEIHSGGADTAKLAQAAVDQAKGIKSLASAADTQARVAIRALITDERAWISSTGAGKTDPPIMQSGKPFTITVEFKNTGKSPALNISTENQMNHTGNASACKIQYLEDDTVHVGVIGPGMTFHGTTAIRNVSPELLASFTTQKEVFCVFGKIEYEDIYRRPHRTTYCLRYGQTFDGHPLLLTCPNYNEMDPEEKIEYQPTPTP